MARTGSVLLACWMLTLAEDRFAAWSVSGNGQQLDNYLWFVSMGLLIGAGFLFGLATWFPFTKVRYLPSRLLLALLALFPLAHFWWIFIRPQPVGPYGRFRWFEQFTFQFVFAVLAGVAIASGFRTRAAGSAETVE